MDSLSCSLDNRSFQALLNGLSKRLFYQESTFSNDFLADQLYSSSELDRTEIISQISSFQTLLSTAAEFNWDPSKFEEGLRRSETISPDHLRILVTFWAHEREKIHAKLITKSTWNRHFKKLAWRVDVKAASKNSQTLNEPVALFEYSSTPGYRSTTRNEKEGSQNVRFDLNRAQVGELLSSLDAIQNKLDEFTR